jgi:hypothetical protein
MQGLETLEYTAQLEHEHFADIVVGKICVRGRLLGSLC